MTRADEHPLPAAFALQQSYLKQVAAVSQPGTPPDLSGLPVQAHVQPSWSALSGPVPGLWARVQTLLCLAAAPLRTEPHATYNPHRSYPSPRALYSVHVLIETDTGCWLFEPNRHRLLGPAPFRPPTRVTLHLVGHPGTVPATYGALGLSLVGLEGGHLRGALSQLAGPLGLTLSSGVPTPVPGLLPHPSEWTVLSHLIVGMGVADGAATSLVWDAMQARSSGTGPNGLAADWTQLPAAPVLAALLALKGADAPASVYLLAQRLDDLPDGLYRSCVGLQPLPTPSARAAALLQEAYSYPAPAGYIEGLNAVFLLTARYAPGRSFMDSQLQLGEAAQRAALILGTAGLFARPVRAYREAPLDALLGLGPDETVAYMLLCGRSGFQDVTLPLLRRTP